LKAAEELKETKVTQPAVFLHSVILAKTLGDDFKPNGGGTFTRRIFGISCQWCCHLKTD
jgi:DNA-directed RNA polymerase beta' subunit